MTPLPLRARGGATIPYPFGLLLVEPYPFAHFEADGMGVTVSGSGGPFALLDADVWSVAWDDLEAVEFAGRSVRLVPRKGRSCRFFTFSAKRVRSIEEAVPERVHTHRILTTLLIYSWPRRRWARRSGRH